MKIHKLSSGFEFCSSSGQRRNGNEEMGDLLVGEKHEEGEGGLEMSEKEGNLLLG